MNRPIYRLPVDERRQAAGAFVGFWVRATFHLGRDRSRVLVEVGKLVAIALPRVGTVADLVILKRAGQENPRAWTIAELAELELASAIELANETAARS